jgi:TolB-like protein/cytochrome c-type biogenesis protein CcmH/NrfG
MSDQVKGDLHFEIGHVLFIDIVGYSQLLISEQRERVETLSRLVRNTPQFRASETAGELIRLPAGDGMALVFSHSVEAPVECAIELSRELKKHPEVRVRMGVHSGPVSGITDVNDRSNVAGAGINVAQRVMDRGDAGHILLSRHVADDLEQYSRWRPQLHDLGECEIKHGRKLGIVNLYSSEVGNPAWPSRFKRVEETRSFWKQRFVVPLAALCLLLGVLGGYWHRVASKAPDKSIAVLPFVNLSDDKENGYFAGGIQDDILTNLAKIGDLKVISRSSVMKYAGSRQDVRSIGQALGVAAVLEGSVRRSANQVRINVQLINAATDEHIWAEEYDRELTDPFAIQSELALKIASALHTKLTAAEEARLKQRPTQSGEAYLNYLQARDGEQTSDLNTVIVLYKKAIQLDPAFALAFARLSIIENTLYQSTGVPTYLEEAGSAAREALRLQPSLPEAHLAMGFNYYRGPRDYDNALRELALAQEGLPNESEIFLVIGSIKRRQGKWAESTANLEKAAALNPREGLLWANLGSNYRAMRDFAAAARCFKRGIAAEPDEFVNHWLLALLLIDQNGDLSRMEKLLAGRVENPSDRLGQITLAGFQLKMMQRKFGEALQLISDNKLELFSNWKAPTRTPRSLLLGRVYIALNDNANAGTSFDQARQVLEQAVRENPGDASRHALLGEAYARLGRKEEAIREGKQATELLPESKDAFDGPQMTIALARIYCETGEPDQALTLLEHSLVTPAGISKYELQLDPAWDSLRSKPRFQQLLASPAAKQN